MSANSKIQWTETTWNPVTGCTPVSSGCLNCYAARDAQRMAGNPNPKISGRYKGLTVVRDGRPVFNGEIWLHEDRLTDPLRWRKPRRVFVNSQSDLFHEDVPFKFIDRVFAVMALTPHHTYQILMKRPERMAEYFEGQSINRGYGAVGPIWAQIHATSQDLCNRLTNSTIPAKLGPIIPDAQWAVPRRLWAQFPQGARGLEWPLPNVWMLASAEDQKTLDERVPHLLRCPAAVRGLSLEPLLGPIDLKRYMFAALYRQLQKNSPCDESRVPSHLRDNGPPSPDWVIAGGESGPYARPCDVAWLRSIRDQCKAAGVPFFMKQVGSWPVDAGMAKWPGETKPRRCDRVFLADPKGGDMTEWPEDLRVREFPKEAR